MTLYTIPELYTLLENSNCKEDLKRINWYLMEYHINERGLNKIFKVYWELFKT